MTELPVLVTTEHRGVFFGYAKADDVAAWEADSTRTIGLRACRNCVFWPTENKGFIGLASKGPVAGARVGPAADHLRIAKITSIADVSEEAVLAWERAPWK